MFKRKAQPGQVRTERRHGPCPAAHSSHRGPSLVMLWLCSKQPCGLLTAPRVQGLAEGVTSLRSRCRARLALLPSCTSRLCSPGPPVLFLPWLGAQRTPPTPMPVSAPFQGVPLGDSVSSATINQTFIGCLLASELSPGTRMNNSRTVTRIRCFPPLYLGPSGALGTWSPDASPSQPAGLSSCPALSVLGLLGIKGR